MYGIQLQKRNREAMYNERLSGINANSGSIYRGDYLWYIKSPLRIEMIIF